MDVSNFKRYCPRCGKVAVGGHSCNDAVFSNAAAHGAASSTGDGSAVGSTVPAPPPFSEPPSPTGGPSASQVPPPLPRAAAHAAKHASPKRVRRPLMEILLDPRSIRWLLASGGGLLVAGLVIWLASLGVFKDPAVVATLLGAGTLALLGSGWSTMRLTRFHLAGLALTLLACLVMPLNLWFYHANQLLTLDGNLWVAAVVCCVLYAASAAVVRDPLFVYVLMAGVTGTGMLILGDMQRLHEITAPALVLAVMGLLGIHAERAFADDEGEFSRKRFGLAFFFSGHALLGAGLALVLGAQLATFVLNPLFPGLHLGMSDITIDPALKMLAVGIILAGTYAYVYSDLIVRKAGYYTYAAAFTLLWAELVGFEMLNLVHGNEVILAALAFTALVLNVLHAILDTPESRLSRPIAPLAMLLSVVPVSFGTILYLRSAHIGLGALWPYSIGYGYVAAMVITAITCRIGAFVYRKNDETATARSYLYLTGISTIIAAAGLLSVMQIINWSTQAPILMLIPIGYLIASRLYRAAVEREAFLKIASASSAVLLVSVLAAAVDHFNDASNLFAGPTNLPLAIFFAEAAIFYSSMAAIRRTTGNIFLATASAGGAVFELLRFWHPAANVYIIVFGAIGLVLLIASRFAALVTRVKAMTEGWMIAGNGLITISFLSSAMLVLSRLLSRTYKWENMSLLGIEAAITLIAAAIATNVSWRRAFRVMAVVNGAMAGLVLALLGHLTFGQKLEILTTASGMALLVVGHINLYRHQDEPDAGGHVDLFFGAMLAVIPLMIASVINRFFGDGFSLPDEMALITISAMLLISGVLLELRSTTLVGGGFLLLHLAILIADAGLKAQLALGVYLSIGGGAIFLVGLALAIYRERLTQLPEKIHNREGIFRVLAWR